MRNLREKRKKGFPLMNADVKIQPELFCFYQK